MTFIFFFFFFFLASSTQAAEMRLFCLPEEKRCEIQSQEKQWFYSQDDPSLLLEIENGGESDCSLELQWDLLEAADFLNSVNVDVFSDGERLFSAKLSETSTDFVKLGNILAQKNRRYLFFYSAIISDAFPLEKDLIYQFHFQFFCQSKRISATPLYFSTTPSETERRVASESSIQSRQELPKVTTNKKKKNQKQAILVLVASFSLLSISLLILLKWRKFDKQNGK